MEWGAAIKVKIIAKNVYGSSQESLVGSGAVILTIPDPPTNFVEDYSKRSASTLGFTWKAPVQTGGTLLLDYQVEMARAGSDYAVIASALTSESYVATGLTSGITYQFRVKARTEFGLSNESKLLSLLCAYKPEPPQAVYTSNDGKQVLVQWSNPVTNGSPITEYKIYVKKSQSNELIQET